MKILDEEGGARRVVLLSDMEHLWINDDTFRSSGNEMIGKLKSGEYRLHSRKKNRASAQPGNL
jgi:hypothetical protein